VAVLLVHGGWHGAWCWEPLLPHLAARGLDARTVDLPSCGKHAGSLGDLNDDAETVRAALREIDEPAVVCAHSWGGVVVTEACAGLDRVRHIVFLCAYVPDASESVAVLREGRPARPWVVACDGTLQVDRDAAADVLYHDCDSGTAAWAVERLVPQSAACLTQAASAAAWREIPATYALTTSDRVIEPELQRRMASRAARRVVELPTGHSPFLARPELVADLIAASARWDD
jgi:pimeloyl-ACP methyl ester carboxylesterase